MAFLNDLKTQTAPQHEALESQMDIVRHFASRTSYLQLIERFFTLYEPLEDRLAQAMSWEDKGWDFENRRKTPWLRQDLAALGLNPGEISALPRCADIPEIPGEAEAIGCLYVLEGSTLGGQVITRLLGRHLEIPPAHGGQFFSGYGPQTGPNWKKFGEWAEAWASRHPEQESAAIRCAQQTFDSFSRWFQ